MSIFPLGYELSLNHGQSNVYSLGTALLRRAYRCYDSIHNRLYTTMDCDFFEQSYYYTQPRSQGESVSEDLSWLIHPLADSRDSKEQVGTTTDIATNIVTEPSPQTTPVPEHPTEQEVTPSSPSPFIDISTNDIVPSSVVVPRKYELPLQSTRGMPPKRYDPEFKSQRSRYSICRQDDEQLSQTTVAFNTSLYSSTIPKSTEEALRDPKWKQAMNEEIMALQKNETWEKCMLLSNKKTVGCKWVFSVKYHADGTIERYKARACCKRVHTDIWDTLLGNILTCG